MSESDFEWKRLRHWGSETGNYIGLARARGVKSAGWTNRGPFYYSVGAVIVIGGFALYFNLGKQVRSFPKCPSCGRANSSGTPGQYCPDCWWNAVGRKEWEKEAGLS